VLFVSHDRYFVNAVATRVLELTEEGAKSYVGNYDDYLSAKESQRAARAEAARTAPQEKTVNGNYRTKEDKKKEAQKREAIARTEKALEAIEQQINDLTEKLSTGEGDWKQMAEWDKQLTAANAEEERLYALLETLTSD
jgi:ATP-binding cassette subfamily F protein 3